MRAINMEAVRRVAKTMSGCDPAEIPPAVTLDFHRPPLGHHPHLSSNVRAKKP